MKKFLMIKLINLGTPPGYAYSSVAREVTHDDHPTKMIKLKDFREINIRVLKLEEGLKVDYSFGFEEVKVNRIVVDSLEQIGQVIQKDIEDLYEEDEIVLVYEDTGEEVPVSEDETQIVEIDQESLQKSWEMFQLLLMFFKLKNDLPV